MGPWPRTDFSLHDVRVIGSSIPAVHATYTRSRHRFARHWHDVYGFGLIEHGAQRLASGRGLVSAYAGQVITTNPGEVHDGHPLGADTRDWRIVSVDADTMASFIDVASGTFEIAQPVIDDRTLAPHSRAQWMARFDCRRSPCADLVPGVRGDSLPNMMTRKNLSHPLSIQLLAAHGYCRRRTDYPLSPDGHATRKSFALLGGAPMLIR
jgi:hypothetical protein